MSLATFMTDVNIKPVIQKHSKSYLSEGADRY